MIRHLLAALSDPLGILTRPDGSPTWLSTALAALLAFVIAPMAVLWMGSF